MNKKPFIRFAVFMGAFWAFTALAATSREKLVPAMPGEVQNLKSVLDVRLLPQGATRMQADTQQVFHLVSQNTTQTTLVPVTFRISIQNFVKDEPGEGSYDGDGTAELSECGIYFISQKGVSHFVWTLGEGNSLLQCDGVQAVGLGPITHGNPALILIFKGSTHNEAFSQPYVFSWNQSTQSYQIDKAWSRRVDEMNKAPTIKTIQQFMSQKN